MTIYEKRGRRYIPYGDTTDFPYVIPYGTYIVHKSESGRSVTNVSHKTHIEVLAALYLFKEELVAAVAAQMKMRPSKTPLTKREQKALKAYYEIAGEKSMLVFQIDSVYGMVEKAIDEFAAKLVEANVEEPA